jgi:hypothetical protein
VEEVEVEVEVGEVHQVVGMSTIITGSVIMWGTWTRS